MSASSLLCDLNTLNHQPNLGVTLGEHNYLIVTSDQGPRVYLNRCPHLGIPLEWQEHQFLDNDTGLIRCATHGALFLPSTGECVSGPCVGDALLAVPCFIDGDKLYLGPTPA